MTKRVYWRCGGHQPIVFECSPRVNLRTCDRIGWEVRLCIQNAWPITRGFVCSGLSSGLGRYVLRCRVLEKQYSHNQIYTPLFLVEHSSAVPAGGQSRELGVKLAFFWGFSADSRATGRRSRAVKQSGKVGDRYLGGALMDGGQGGTRKRGVGTISADQIMARRCAAVDCLRARWLRSAPGPFSDHRFRTRAA